MNKIDRSLAARGRDDEAYEADYALWCAKQAALLRAGRFDVLDRENLAEEIEGLARSDRREIESQLRRLLAHLLKYRFQPEQRSNSWRATIRDQRRAIRKLVEESPSLAPHPRKALGDGYESARWQAIDETGLSESVFPVVCPFTIEQVLDPEFLPD